MCAPPQKLSDLKPRSTSSYYRARPPSCAAGRDVISPDPAWGLGKDKGAGDAIGALSLSASLPFFGAFAPRIREVLPFKVLLVSFKFPPGSRCSAVSSFSPHITPISFVVGLRSANKHQHFPL